MNGVIKSREFRTIKIKTKRTKCEVNEKNVIALQYLDVLQNISRIYDSNEDVSLKTTNKNVNSMARAYLERMVEIAEKYYLTKQRCC